MSLSIIADAPTTAMIYLRDMIYLRCPFAIAQRAGMRHLIFLETAYEYYY